MIKRCGLKFNYNYYGRNKKQWRLFIFGHYFRRLTVMYSMSTTEYSNNRF